MTSLIYRPFAYYYRPFGNLVWQDISTAIKKQAEWELSLTGNELLSFNFQMNEINNIADDALNVPVTGDDFCICENSNRLKVVDDMLCGKAWPSKAIMTGSWVDADNRPELYWDITVMQRDFSTVTTVNLEYKTQTLISTILTDLLLLSTSDKLGGVMVDGTVINKWKLIAPDILVESFEYSGFPTGGLINLLSSIGYKFIKKYYVEPDTTNTIKVFAQLEIVENTGTIPTSPLWVNGITDKIIQMGQVLNPDYTGAYSVDDPQYLFGIKNFEVDPDPSSIKNSLGITAYVQDGLTLTEFTEIQDSKNPKDTFDLGYRYKDIIFVSRFIQCKISNDSVPNATQFSVPQAEAAKMVRDQSRLVAGDYLVCKITHSSVIYYYNFTIAAQLITLVSLAYGSTAIPAAMTVGEDFQLVKSVSILEDNRESAGSTYPNYGCVKNCTLTGNATLRFLKYDIPRPADKVYIAGYKLEQYKSTINNINSISKYDPLPDNLELDFSVTTEQIGILETVQAENAKEAKTVSFLSTLPDPPLPSWKFPVKVTNLYDDIVVVNKVVSKFISQFNAKGKQLIERKVFCTPFRNNFIDAINKIKQSYTKSLKLKNPTTPENSKDKFDNDISLMWSFSDLPRVENLVITGTTADTITISWDALDGADSYRIYASKYEDFSILRHATSYNFYTDSVDSSLTSYTDINLLVGNTYYYKVTAIMSDDGRETDFSDTVSSSNLNDWDSQIEIIGTSTTDGSGNGNDGVVSGNSTVASGIYTGGTTGYMSVPDALAFEDTEKITLAIRFKLTTSGINTYLVIKSKSGFTTSYAYQIQCLADYVYINIYKGFAVLQLQLQLDNILSMDTWYKLGVTIDTTVPTVLLSLNGSAPAYTETSGTIAGLLAMNSGQAYDISVGGWESDPTNYDLQGQIDWFYKAHGDNILNQSQLNSLTT